jgi:hypothetical protein
MTRFLPKSGIFMESAQSIHSHRKNTDIRRNFVVADRDGMIMAVPAHDQRDFEFKRNMRYR